MNAPVRIAPAPERLRLRVEDFELLADSGAFADCGKTELIDGVIYYMNAQWSRHGRAKLRLAIALTNRLVDIGSDLEVLSEVSMRAADDSMPEPDILVTRYKGDRAVPAATVALVAEIADTTLDADLGRKVALYAAAGVPEYWVVDVNGGRVVQFDGPGPDGYARRAEAPLGQALASTMIAGLAVETAGLV